MKWKAKNKCACALIVPDNEDFNFLPLAKSLGYENIKLLLNLSLSWQIRTLKYLHTATDCDLYVYIYGTNPLKRKDELKKQLQPVKPFCRSKKSMGIASDRMSLILDELSKKYFRSVVWNIESPLLTEEHLLRAIQTNILLKLESTQSRPLLLSHGVYSDMIETVELEKIVLPSFYDLHSIADIIANMNCNNTSKDRTLELGRYVDLIRRNHPDEKAFY
ncbi:MAG: hypothetical protein OEV66_08850 [Spirochaetia bacterium]|nr:hypothetical protein [Spirochaetia bacterium]